MFSVIWSVLVGIVKGIFGLETAPKDPTAVELSASNATAQAQLSQEKAANDVVQEAAAARAAADARLVHDDPGPINGVNTDPRAAINTSPDAHFRD